MSGASAAMKGDRELTLAQTVLDAKSGAGLPGERIVRSTNCPPSPCNIRTRANTDGSLTEATLKQTTIGGATTAVVEMLYDVPPPKTVNPIGGGPADIGS